MRHLINNHEYTRNVEQRPCGRSCACTRMSENLRLMPALGRSRKWPRASLGMHTTNMVGCNAPNCAQGNLRRQSSWTRKRATRDFVRAARQLELEGRLEPSDRAPFDCFWACAACGHLHRTPARCPACGSQYSVDLGSEAHFDAFKDAAKRDAANRRGRIARRLMAVTAAVSFTVTTAAAWSLIPAGETLAVPFASTVFGLAALGGAGAIGRPLSASVDDPSHKRLWRGPAPALAAAHGIATARGLPRVQTLAIAPFSGEPCIGYVARVLNERGSVRVLEQAHADLELGSERVASNHAAIVGTTFREPVCSTSDDDVRIKRWCRARGIDLVDGDYRLEEGLLVLGDALELGRSEDGRPTLRSLGVAGSTNYR